ncbi:S8 family serine peptidase [Nonomuraea sp. 10N515B]|uniref:S8 family serine peptidase n=1 Tax=Nonomuraea sp. 10N515B TaxID=3457422 RepID=UPI003FCC3FE4
MHLASTSIYPHMDPRLQWALSRYQDGMLTMATNTSSETEVAVLALVEDADAFAARDDVRLGAVIGEVDGHRLVTARVPFSGIEPIRRAAGVRSLKLAQAMMPMLQATVQDLKAAPAAWPPGALAAGGAGVVVGVVDYGLDFAHRNFLRPDGSTRVAALWDQTAASGPDSPFGYGKRHSSRDIDLALAAEDPYRALGYDPGENPPTLSPGRHGTHVADIAAGNGGGSGTPGVAPESAIAFVQISHSDITWQGPEVVEDFLGDSVHMLEAVRFLFDEAAERPCAINISIGTNGGPHDGSSLVERGLDAMLSERPNRMVVLSAGNSFNDGVHAAGAVAAGGTSDLRWVIPEVSPSSPEWHGELEIWYSGRDRFTAKLIDPSGTSLGSVPLGSNGRLVADDGTTTLLFVSHRRADPLNGDNVVDVFLERHAGPGAWTIRLHGEQVNDGGYHAWIERNNVVQTTFAEPRDNSHTLGSIACGRLALAVGSYDAHTQGSPLSGFSASGPTRDGRQRPELSAPGHKVVAARSKTGTGVIAKSGTSMAAPAVTGLTALVLAEAHARGVELDIETLRRIVILAARTDPPPAEGWHARYGHGRAEVAEALRAVQKLAQG